MPRCQIDLVASPTFQRHLRDYQRRYPHTVEDLREALQRIEADHAQAAHARQLVRFGAASVWKYRFRQSDARRGGRGGYRLIAVYDPEAAILYPIILYAKVDRGDVLPGEIKAAFFALRDALG